jgi:hypothetical protein
MRKILWVLLVLFAILAIAYALGPAPQTPVYSRSVPAVPAEAYRLETYIRKKESQHKIKPDNEARIIWSAQEEDTLFNGVSTRVQRIPGRR